jgi:chromate transporter
VRAASPGGRDLLAWGLAALATVVVWRTRVHLLWLLALGALAGGLRAVLAA